MLVEVGFDAAGLDETEIDLSVGLVVAVSVWGLEMGMRY